MAKEYFSTEYDRNTFINAEGIEETLKIFTGIDRVDDYWLLEEFCTYVEVQGKIKGNYDRLVSFLGALFICKIYQQNRFIKRRSEVEKVETNNLPKQRPVIDMLGGGIRRIDFSKPKVKHKPISFL
jgi:hypothetical protein